MGINCSSIFFVVLFFFSLITYGCSKEATSICVCLSNWLYSNSTLSLAAMWGSFSSYFMYCLAFLLFASLTRSPSSSISQSVRWITLVSALRSTSNSQASTSMKRSWSFLFVLIREVVFLFSGLSVCVWFTWSTYPYKFRASNTLDNFRILTILVL